MVTFVKVGALSGQADGGGVLCAAMQVASTENFGTAESMSVA